MWTRYSCRLKNHPGAKVFTLTTSNRDALTTSNSVWSAAIEALNAFIRCFVYPDVVNKGILLQPVLLYLNRALNYISSLSIKAPDVKASMDILISRTLIGYQSLSYPKAYKSDHPQLIQICTSPFREAAKYEESSYLRILLDSRDAWLGPWIPGSILEQSLKTGRRHALHATNVTNVCVGLLSGLKFRLFVFYFHP